MGLKASEDIRVRCLGAGFFFRSFFATIQRWQTDQSAGTANQPSSADNEPHTTLTMRANHHTNSVPTIQSFGHITHPG
jgi:hypothetical protein